MNDPIPTGDTEVSNHIKEHILDDWIKIFKGRYNEHVYIHKNFINAKKHDVMLCFSHQPGWKRDEIIYMPVICRLGTLEDLKRMTDTEDLEVENEN